MDWLLTPETFRRLEFLAVKYPAPTVEQKQELEARRRGSGDSILQRRGRVAQIPVEGVLTRAPDFWAWLFDEGNTTYTEIIAALAEADADESVDSIELQINSPGGQVAGMFDAMAAIQGTAKPTRAIIGDLGASAAYGLASATDEILAAGRASRIGSIGVAMAIRVREDVVDIASTEAPDKRPDVTTEAGRATVRKELDAIHALFVEGIGAGRGLTSEAVNERFGRGAIVLADDALGRGMIDAIVGPAQPGQKPAAVAAPSEEQMDKILTVAALIVSYPDLCADVRAEGVTAERDRVVAHLTLAEASGETATAIEAVKDGSALTDSITAKHQAAAMRRAARGQRQEDDGAANPADGASSSAETPDLDDQAALLLAARRGVKIQ